MKEMTTEEKAKRYDEALEIAKGLIAGETERKAPVFYVDNILNIFPEIIESKDEKIQRFLIESFKSLCKCCTKNCIYRDDVSYKDVVEWLEKQGEKSDLSLEWKYKKDDEPLLRHSIILTKSGLFVESMAGTVVSGVWVMDIEELRKLPKDSEK